MSDFTKSFQIDTPASTLQQFAVQTQTPLGLCAVEEILITWPPGAAALTFAAIYAGGSPAYPNDPNSFLAFDDYTYVQEVSNQITTGQWSIVTYNTDLYDHTIYVVYKANYVAGQPADSFSPPISL